MRVRLDEIEQFFVAHESLDCLLIPKGRHGTGSRMDTHIWSSEAATRLETKLTRAGICHHRTRRNHRIHR